MGAQAFNKGDLVRVADDLGPYMRHFESGCDAIVIGSYGDQYGRAGSGGGYTIHIKGKGQSSWYPEAALSLVARNRLDLLDTWGREAKELAALHGNLDWIFSHGAEVLQGASGSTVAALAGCSVGDLWGSRGEGFTYYANAMAVLGLAAPYLEAGDKAGWLALRDNPRVTGMSLRGFGMMFDLTTGRMRNWYVDNDGVQRWADNDEPVAQPRECSHIQVVQHTPDGAKAVVCPICPTLPEPPK